MGKRPLKLNWAEILSGDGPPPPVPEVVAADVSDLSEHKPKEKIQKRSGLQDGAACRRATKSSDLVGETGPNVSCNSLRKLEDKSDIAFSEELRFMRQEKRKSLEPNELQLHEERQPIRKPRQRARTSSRKLPSLCYPKKYKQRSTSIYSSYAEKNLSRKLSKRARASAYRGSLNWDFEEVQHVVHLDDEDAESLHSVHDGDTSKNRENYSMYYPSRDDPECVALSYTDQKCLDPECYLSSPVINFYIQYLQRPPSPMAKRKEECYVFNTYFYSKLEEAVASKDRTASFLKLRRWWKGVDIFRKAFIFLPIHGDMHWSLVIICIPAKEDETGLFILHLDSLGLHASSRIFSVVTSYLTDEWLYISQYEPPVDLPISEKIWKRLPRKIEKGKIAVPQQKNAYDCGLFLLYFMQRFIEEAPERLRKQDLSMFGKKWFCPEEASGLRDKVREVLINEFKNRLQHEGQESCVSSLFLSGNGKEQSNGK